MSHFTQQHEILALPAPVPQAQVSLPKGISHFQAT
jgi:hypothetical protein